MVEQALGQKLKNHIIMAELRVEGLPRKPMVPGMI
jgi:hypothetical protein